MVDEPLRIEVALPNGTATVPASWAEPENDPGRGTVIIAHGAGTGMEHPFLVGLAGALNQSGFAAVRFDFPYRAQGRRMPGPAAHAVAAWNAVLAAVRARTEGPVWASGRSYGGRMASMAAAEGMEVDGLVYLGYPLHPPGRPEKPRVEHLPSVIAPQLFVSGTVDPFIQPLEQFEEAVASCQDARIAWIDGGGHSFEVKGNKRPAAIIGASLAPLVVDFAATAR
ncbi:alpha/beta family hydrolase [Microbacterium sp. CIAB417]|uniref:alpha/beta hydrolase family protein n=1 Tax=Microbacterium sp. CIAB417 TaxID=2860287 RepID=UPI001FADD21C|nr:alpha/beta family hydrolase [Microbacterium sp. CIAB417]